ncbi:hypothetical protein RF11_08897 [Thelohanellus kitauei]|uniref:Transmembrane protein n=1 Tax=Thelohanellus kitauei TaxID=669202 RepID=A0A0C2IV01_THEKT|nr:hypothetical protein RF11_08897 [Thelohanellus kitauei]
MPNSIASVLSGTSAKNNRRSSVLFTPPRPMLHSPNFPYDTYSCPFLFNLFLLICLLPLFDYFKVNKIKTIADQLCWKFFVVGDHGHALTCIKFYLLIIFGPER